MKEKEIEKELKAKNPARYYQAMNFELKHMKELQEQKDTILTLDPKKQKLQPFNTRCCTYCKEGAKSSICDLQTIFLFVGLLGSFVFWIVCLMLKDKSDEWKSNEP